MLTQLQRDAMTRAQAGDWSLADAMELLADGRKHYNGNPLIGGVLLGGDFDFSSTATSRARPTPAWI